MLTIDARSPESTRSVGEYLGRLVRGGEVLALCGDLGAGKTTFVQGLAAGMGVRGRVTSPTFVLVNEYTGERGRCLVHIDTYRLAEGITVAEAATFGLAEQLDGADADAQTVVAIEWADRVESLLPADLLRIELAPTADDPDARTLRFVASGERSISLLENLRTALPESL
jgi:tRNA threonylcarbamoyladenosine biosynthesis protein TsaE